MQKLRSLEGSVLEVFTVVPYGVEPIEVVLNEREYKIRDQGVSKFFGGGKLVGILVPIEVSLVTFVSAHATGRIDPHEIWDWGKGRNLAPFFPEHLCGLVMNYPGSQKNRKIIALGGEEKGQVLCLWGKGDWKGASTFSSVGNWGGVGSDAYTFGFVPKKPQFGSLEVPSLSSGTSRIIR